MSHIVSLRSASLRALRSSSTAVATKCTTYSPRSNLYQQQCSFSTLPPSPTRIVSKENNKFTKRVRDLFDSRLYDSLMSSREIVFVKREPPE